MRAPSETPSPWIPPRWRRWAALALLVAALGLYIPRFAANAAPPQFDQRLFVTQVFAPDHYPALTDGISAFLLAGTYNRLAGHSFDADLITADTFLKSSAAALFLVAGYLLFTAIPRPRQGGTALLCLALILTTRFPFGWLSTEVFAGAFLMLALWSYTRGLPLALTGVFLALFSFSKPDLIFSGGLVAAYLVIQHGQRTGHWLRGAGIMAFIFGVLLVPALWQHGFASGRTLLSLHQHYAVAVARHQITDPAPDPWAETHRYSDPLWGQHANPFAAIRANPRLYYDYLWLSVGNTAYNIAASGVVWLGLAWAYALWRLQRRDVLIITGLLLLGILPITAFSFMHTRYLTRFYPLLLWAVYLYAAENEAPDRRDQALSIYLLGLLVFQLWRLPPVVEDALWHQTTVL
ncbi:MAG: hypothetical protein ACLFTK_08205 [Anaerolineales bacterium]